MIAVKAEPISEIWREILKMPCRCVKTVGSDSPLHSRDCKSARRYGKDYESEVHVNLDFRISPINCIAHVLNDQFDDFRNGGCMRTFLPRFSGHLLSFQNMLERLTVYPLSPAEALLQYRRKPRFALDLACSALNREPLRRRVLFISTFSFIWWNQYLQQEDWRKVSHLFFWQLWQIRGNL